MRIDKFTWCVRLAKTRNAAWEFVSKGKVILNSLAVKPSKQVKPGDTIGIKIHQAIFEYEILRIPKSRVGAKLVTDLIQDLTKPQEKEKHSLFLLNQATYRQNGKGKPNAKQRRTIKRFLEQ